MHTVTIEATEQDRGSPRHAARAGGLGTESAFDVLDHARRLEALGQDVIHLEIGEPDWFAPDAALEEAIRALRAQDARYTSPAGLPGLRERIADRLRKRGADADTDRVVVLPGAKPALLFAALLLVEEGDEALVPDPGFPIYPSVVRFAGGRAVPYPLDRTHGFSADPDLILSRVTPRTRLLFLNAPHNPTGGVVGAADLARIAALAHEHDFTIVADEVYADLRFDGETASIATVPGIEDRLILVDSASKRFGMTGWRLGWAVLPRALVDPFTRLVINSVSCVPPFIQRAGIAALDAPATLLEERVRGLRAKRDLLVDGLRTIPGITCELPAGGLYAFPNVEPLLQSADWTTAQFADALLDRYALATLAGTGFGANGEGHIRLSYAAQTDRLSAAVRRIHDLAHSLLEGP